MKKMGRPRGRLANVNEKTECVLTTRHQYVNLGLLICRATKWPQRDAHRNH